MLMVYWQKYWHTETKSRNRNHVRISLATLLCIACSHRLTYRGKAMICNVRTYVRVHNQNQSDWWILIADRKSKLKNRIERQQKVAYCQNENAYCARIPNKWCQCLSLSLSPFLAVCVFVQCDVWWRTFNFRTNQQIEIRLLSVRRRASGTRTFKIRANKS